MPDKIRGNMLIVGEDSDLLPKVQGLELPSVESRTYVLVDNDAQECRVISEDELDASYVDNNIESFQLQDINLLTLDADNHDVTITYNNGAQTAILLGSIDFDERTQVEQYAKQTGIIYPIDDSGHVQLDATNTPNLAAVRTWYWKETKRINDERLEIAEIVHAFASIMELNSGLGE